MFKMIQSESNHSDMATADTENLAFCNCRLQSTNVDGSPTSLAAESTHIQPHPYSVLESHAPAQSLRTPATMGNAMCIPEAHKPIPASTRMASTHVARCTDQSVEIALS